MNAGEPHFNYESVHRGGREVKLPDTGKPFLDYETTYGEVEKVNLELGTYSYGNNLYVGLSYIDPELGVMEPYTDVTVNIFPLDSFMTAVDTNDNGAEKITAFLMKNGIAEPTGGALPSGFCMYPVFEFNPEKLAELDPRGFKQHCKDAGIGFKPNGGKPTRRRSTTRSWKLKNAPASATPTVSSASGGEAATWNCRNSQAGGRKQRHCRDLRAMSSRPPFGRLNSRSLPNPSTLRSRS